MDKKTTPSFSSSSVKPRSADNALPDGHPQPSGKMSNPTRPKPWLHSRWMTETNPISTFVDGRACEVFGRDLFSCPTPPGVG